MRNEFDRRRNFGRLVLAAMLALTAASGVPAGTAHAAPALPADRLHFGVSNFDTTWLADSGVPWRYRYEYLAGGVYSSWTSWNSPAGAFASNYIAATPPGTIPVFTYYMLLQSHRAADEGTDDFNNLNNAALMNAYYADFRLLMQKAGAANRTVVIHVEPDLWGYLQQRSGNTTPASVPASVTSSGFPDVQGYPDTAAGFGQALLHLRDLYAGNTVMAIHASLWSSSIDVGSTTDPAVNVAAEADKTAAFLKAAGPWDAVFNDVDDHDAGWWEAQNANTPTSSHWWDPTNRTLPNFARYLAWTAELHARTGVPQVVWQVPEGNQYFLTENNTCGHYQDTVAEYFVAHPAELSAAGLVAVLFGAGNGCQTRHDDSQNDGVTNNNGAPTTDGQGWCNACNTHVSTVADDDGGFLRIFVGRYYATAPNEPTAVTACAADGLAVVSWNAPTSTLPITGYNVAAMPGPVTTSVSGSRHWATMSGLGNGTAYTFQVTASNANGSGPSSAPSNQVAPGAPAQGWPGFYHPLTPARLLDTRDPAFQVSSLAGGQRQELTVLGRGGVPATGVAAVALNVTVTNPRSAGYLTVSPGGSCSAVTSTLNFNAGQTVPNLTLAALGSNGRVAILNGSADSADVVVDLQGWFSDQSAAPSARGRFQASDPIRLLDTRTLGTRLEGGHSVSLQIAGRASVPVGSSAAALNVTVTAPDAAGYVTAFPTGAIRPLASNVNFGPAQTVPNRVLVGLDSNGRADFYNGSSGAIDVVIDLNGSFSGDSGSSAGGLYTGLFPIRILDTRDGTGGSSAPLGARNTLTVPVAGRLGVPATGVAAVVLNITAVSPAAEGFLTAFPGPAWPVASDLNFTTGQTVPNLVIVRVGGDGAVRLYNGSSGPTELVADLLGWFSV